jgi:hypothetical protein
MGLRAQEADQFEVNSVAERLAPYELSSSTPLSRAEGVDNDLVEKAVTLLKVMPLNQHRETVENLVSPNDPQRGRRAVDALIDAAFVTEDERGHLHQTVGRAS